MPFTDRCISPTNKTFGVIHPEHLAGRPLVLRLPCGLSKLLWDIKLGWYFLEMLVDLLLKTSGIITGALSFSSFTASSPISTYADKLFLTSTLNTFIKTHIICQQVNLFVVF